MQDVIKTLVSAGIYKSQGRKGHWNVDYTCTQTFIIKFGYTYQIFVCLIPSPIVQTFQPIILNYRSGNFVYHYLKCIFFNDLNRSISKL